MIRDGTPFFSNFGDVVEDVDGRTFQKGEPITVKFVGANPRNNLRLEGSYAIVEKLMIGKNEGHAGEEAWQVVRDDADWHLVFRWRRISELLGTSEVSVTWETVDPWAEAGTYRIKYFGSAKSLGGTITEFEGVSGSFELVD